MASKIPWKRFPLFRKDTHVLLEIHDRAEARRYMDSKTSCCWGAGNKLDEEGEYIELCSPSRQHAGDKRLVIFCKADLLKPIPDPAQAGYAW